MIWKGDSDNQMELGKIKADITARWDNWSIKYDDQYAHGLKSDEEAAAWKEMLADALGSSPLKVLDAGTGTGFLAILLAELGHSCLGVDLSPGMLDLAKKKVQGKNLQVAFDKGDAEKLSLPDSRFHAVVSRHLLWTLTSPEAAVRECLRVLCPGGILLVINGIWANLGLLNQFRSFIGNIMILVQERRNPWANGYGQNLKEHLPFYGDFGPEAVLELLEQCGAVGIGYINMKKVEDEEKRAMPMRYRLAYSHKRYAIVARKPI